MRVTLDGKPAGYLKSSGIGHADQVENRTRRRRQGWLFDDQGLERGGRKAVTARVKSADLAGFFAKQSLIHSFLSNWGSVMKIQPYVYFNGACEDHGICLKPPAHKVTMLAQFKLRNLSGNRSGERPKDRACRICKSVNRTSLSPTVAAPRDEVRRFFADRCGADRRRGGASVKHAARMMAVKWPCRWRSSSSKFGMVNDRFGVIWMVIVEA